MDVDENLAVSVARVRRDLRTGRARAIREAANVTQAEVALSVGTTRATVALWEQRRRVPRGPLAIRLACVLDQLEALDRDKIPA